MNNNIMNGNAINNNQAYDDANRINSDDDDEDDGHSFHAGKASCFDHTSIKKDPCIEACQATISAGSTQLCSVDHMTMCGGDLSRLFNNKNRDDNDDDHHHSSNNPLLYSPSAPVGPTRCEYCDNSNTDDCKSNLPEEYMQFMSNGNLDNAKDRAQSSKSSEIINASNHNGRTTNPSNENAEENIVIPCPRPQLFFLKKRPPFASPDGWNPIPEYRNNLFEPPSSVEGMGRGWGEVRGHLSNSNKSTNTEGCSGGVNATTAAAFSNATTTTATRNYTTSACGSSVCGGGGGDTEISFSSAGGGGGGGGGAAADKVSDGGRSLSPVQWVSSLMGSLSPS